LTSASMPFFGLVQICDSLAGSCNGILRGIGKQKVGGWAALVSYYAVSTSSVHPCCLFVSYCSSENKFVSFNTGRNSNIARLWIWITLEPSWVGIGSGSWLRVGSPN
jgi:Na+-driven multidrug efflux pump